MEKRVWSLLGKFCFKESKGLDELERRSLIPVWYCDASGKPTTKFPKNPNGSPRFVIGFLEMIIS